MVNLVRGRRSFYCKLSKEASIVQFDETGEKFLMVVDEKISVHESEDAKLICELDNRKRVLCAAPGAVRPVSLTRFFNSISLYISFLDRKKNYITLLFQVAFLDFD